MELKLVDSFQTKAESFQLIDLLEKNNIPYIQKSEDGGGKYACFISFSRVKIFVSAEDYHKVIKLINY